MRDTVILMGVLGSTPMRITAISDMHGYLPPIPDTDILIVAGDSSPVYMSHSPDKQMTWWEEAFGPWLLGVRASHKVIIGGNHDFNCQAYPDAIRRLAHLWTQQGFGRVHYLQDEAAEIYGIKMYGYPWIPNLKSWAFYAHENTLRAKAGAVPADTEILVTHGCPEGMGDMMWDKEPKTYRHVGDRPMREEFINRLHDVKLHVFGHIHEAYGVYGVPFRTTIHHNVSHLDRDYCTTHPIVQYDREGGVYTQVVKETA